MEGSTQVSTIGQLELSKETIFDLANQVQQPRTPYRDSFVPIQVSIQENQKESSYPTNEKMDRDRSRGVKGRIEVRMKNVGKRKEGWWDGGEIEEQWNIERR